MRRAGVEIFAALVCFTAGLLCAHDGEAWKAFGLALLAGVNAATAMHTLWPRT